MSKVWQTNEVVDVNAVNRWEKFTNWDGAIPYVTNDVSISAGLVYTALQNGTNKIPASNPTYWRVWNNVEMGAYIFALTGKTTPLDADSIGISDSAASNVGKKVTLTNFKAFLKTYFDTLYNKYVHPNHSGDVTSVADGANTIAAKAVTLAKMNDLAANTIIGRVTASTGVPEALTAANIRTIINVADGANAYVHPNHSGDVTSVADGANTIVSGAVTLAKMANMATGSLIYRKTAATGAPEVQTLATLKTDLGLTGTNSGDSSTPAETVTTIGALINGSTLKATPVNADILGFVDTEASNVIKKFTFTNLKAFLKTYFDTLYGTMTSPMTTASDIIYGGVSGAPTRLAKGTAGQLLQMNSGATAPEWGSIATSSASAPTVNSDSTAGYAKGSIWLYTLYQLLYYCIDNSAGAALWAYVAGVGRLIKLWSSGVTNALVTSWVFTKSNSGVAQNDGTYFTLTVDQSTGVRSALVSTGNAIDTTTFTTLTVYFYTLNFIDVNSNLWIGLDGDSTSYKASGWDFSSSTTGSGKSNSTYYTLTLDITSANGNYYIKTQAQSDALVASSVRIYDIKLSS